MSTLESIDDIANLRSIPTAIAAEPGSIAIENVANVLKQVDDQGVATSIGGGSGTVTSVAATASGLLAVAGTPTIAPTVGMAAMAASTLVANATAGSAVPTAVPLGTGLTFSAGSLVNSAPFGADTIIQINNSAASPVSAWEGIATLTTNTAGAEVSKYVVKLLSAGAQVTALDLRPTQLLAPNGALNAPAYSFQNAPGNGMWWDSVNSRLAFSIGNTTGGIPDMFLTSTGQLNLEFSAPKIVFHSDGANTIGRTAGGALQFISSGGAFLFGNSNTGFFGGAGAAKQTVTGSKGANAALTSLLTALAAYGFVTDSST